MPQLTDRMLKGQIDPSAVSTHRVTQDDIPKMYDLCNKEGDGVIKVPLKP